jgi:lambda family phage portal protein
MDWRFWRKSSKPARRAHRGRMPGRSFAAADSGRLNLDWRGTGADVNLEIEKDLAKLRNRARELGRNNVYHAGALSFYVDQSVGRGIMLQHASKNVETTFREWCRPIYCDAAGKLNLTELQRLWMRSRLESGEVFIHKVRGYERGLGVPVFLETLEADHVPHDYNGEFEGRQIRQGIELNKFNQPVAYWVLKEHPGSKNGTPRGEMVRYEASEIIHYFRPTRPGQLRGIPHGVAGMVRLKDLGAYEEAEIAASRMAASKAIWFENESGVMPDTDSDGDAYMDWEWGSVGVLPRGWKVAKVDPQHPTTQLEGFVTHELRGVAAAWNLAYESVTRDYSKTTYSSARTAILPEREMFRIEQEFMIAHVLTRVFGWFMVAGHTGSEEVEAPLNEKGWFGTPAERRKVLNAATWHPPAGKEIDPLKESNAHALKLEKHMETYQSYYGDQGKDWKEIFKQIAVEKALREELGLTVGDVTVEVEEDEQGFAKTVKKAPKTADAEGDKPAAGKPVGEEATTAPEISLNGAQVTALLEVVHAVAEKRLPRETGVQIIMVAFALSAEQADAVMGDVGKTFFADADDEKGAEAVQEQGAKSLMRLRGVLTMKHATPPAKSNGAGKTLRELRYS